MTSIVRSTDKRSGITYVYESESFWVPGKGPRNKRRLIGKVDPETGEVVPTDGRRRRAAERKAAEAEAKAIGGVDNTVAPDARYIDALERHDEALASIEAEVRRMRAEIASELSSARGNG